jgi:hypothetical protein
LVNCCAEDVLHKKSMNRRYCWEWHLRADDVQVVPWLVATVPAITGSLTSDVAGCTPLPFLSSCERNSTHQMYSNSTCAPQVPLYSSVERQSAIGNSNSNMYIFIALILLMFLYATRVPVLPYPGSRN